MAIAMSSMEMLAIFSRSWFENILKGHKALPPQMILIEPPAQGVFGTGRGLPSGHLHRHADKLRQKTHRI